MTRLAAYLAPLCLLAGASVLAAPLPPPKPRTAGKEPIGCVLKGPATCKLGSVPALSVRLINQTKKEMLLVGSLDASSWQRRLPFCYYEITGPDGKPVTVNFIRCKFMNPLREKDFVKVPSGESFDPFQKIDDYGFFGAHQLRKETFDKPGKYTIRFVYSTEGADQGKWNGSGEVPKLRPLIALVPRLTVRSNEVVVEVKK